MTEINGMYMRLFRYCLCVKTIFWLSGKKIVRNVYTNQLVILYRPKSLLTIWCCYFRSTRERTEEEDKKNVGCCQCFTRY